MLATRPPETLKWAFGIKLPGFSASDRFNTAIPRANLPMIPISYLGRDLDLSNIQQKMKPIALARSATRDSPREPIICELVTVFVISVPREDDDQAFYKPTNHDNTYSCVMHKMLVLERAWLSNMERRTCAASPAMSEFPCE